MEFVMRRILFALFAGVAIASVSALTAVASTPIHGTFDNGYESFVDTEVCSSAPWGFDVNATEHFYGSYEFFTARDGSFLRAIVQANYDATISANGKTIVERDTWTSFFYPDGSREVGLTVHIQGPGGIVQRDAGQVVRDVNGNLVYVIGPHDQALGGSFCPALAH
jgi:hypothetical protein